MSREIKFRAWNGYAKAMYEVDLLHLRNRSQIVPTLEGNYMSLVYQPKTVLMQYTGLRDRNGRDIYEGDILRLKNSKGKVSNHQEVYWNQESASFDWRTANDDSRPDGFTGFYDEYEVIGNIYENPELLDAH